MADSEVIEIGDEEEVIELSDDDDGGSYKFESDVEVLDETPCRFCGKLGCISGVCATKASKFCASKLPCGHYCGGLAREPNPHLVCLHSACAPPVAAAAGGAAAAAPPLADDFCCVCYTDVLSEAPCIQLDDCGHIFHAHCIRALIDSKWDGPRLSFTRCMSCPLCKAPLRHRSLVAPLAPFTALRAAVEGMAVRRIVVEGLWPPKEDSPAARAVAVAAAKAAAPAHNGAAAASTASASAAAAASSASASESVDTTPLGLIKLQYAMDKLSYYACTRCAKPFFAGLAVCEVAGGSSGGSSSSSAGGAGASAAASVAAPSAGAGGDPGGSGAGSKRKREREDGRGGAAASAAAFAAAVAAAEAAAALLCADCRGPPPGRPSNCPLHGFDPAYKCKYCCSRATHVCR